jgi:hypothetical protein
MICFPRLCKCKNRGEEGVMKWDEDAAISDEKNRSLT